METYEKKYKEAQKWIESIYTELSHERQMEVEAFFPEIFENEDERIREMLIKFFSKGAKNNCYTESIADKDIIAWLEKQGEQKNKENTDFTIYYPLKNGKGKYESIPYSFYGTLTSFSENIDLINFLRNCFYSEEECEEWIKKQSEQKPTDKTAPKFKVSDIMRTLQEASDNITSGLPIIVSIDKEYYHCTNELIAIRDQDGYEYPPMNRIQKPAWTIQDAKDGDVLVSAEVIFIFNKVHSVWINCHCSLHKDESFIDEDYDLMHIKYSKEVCPATKEQRNILFKKMKEAGYEWNAKKKELKKIAQNNNEETNEGNCETDGLYYAKAILEKTFGKVEGYQSDDGILEHKSAINAVTKLYDKISRGTRINWEPSDEQVKAFEHFVESIGESGFASPYDSNTKLVYSLLSDLKKLKEE